MGEIFRQRGMAGHRRKNTLSTAQRKRWKVAFSAFWFLLFSLAILFGYGPIVWNSMALDGDQRRVQAYMDIEGMTAVFRCERLYGAEGNAPLSKWREDPEGVNVGDDLQGRPWYYTIRHGRRAVAGSEELTGKPPIVFLGESSTFGYALRDEETLPSFLQVEVGKEYQVINLASSGLDMEALLSNWGRVADWHPKILIVAMSQNCLWNYLTTRRCLGVNPIPVFNYRPTNPKALLDIGNRWRDRLRQKVLGDELVHWDRVTPERYRKNLNELFASARDIGANVIFLEHAFIFKHIEKISGFDEIVRFRAAARQATQDFGIPYLRMKDWIDKMPPAPDVPAGDALTRMTASGYSKEELDRVFHAQEAFVDMLHPSARMNKTLAKVLVESIPISSTAH